ncbi:MAG: MFS transporter [Chloroflexota bacterium]
MMTHQSADPNIVQRRNFRYAQIDAIGVSISNVAAPFLPVFLARLGASNFQVGLLSSMPGITGLILAIIVGRFLQTRKNIIPWFSISRLAFIACYTLIGLITILLPKNYTIITTLIIWAFATLPSTALAVAFSVVMNEIAGPEGRYALLSRRWAIFGLTSVVFTYAVTRVIDLVAFPLNYGLMFLGLSAGGLISYYFSSQISLPDQTPPPLTNNISILESAKSYLTLLRSAPAFVSFSSKRFVYLSALALSAPIMPLFFVNKLGASDSQIGTINMTMTSVMLVGYFFWPWISRKWGGRIVLLTTSLGMIFYPALTAAVPSVKMVIIFAAISGLFQAGLDLVFFDELMKTVPPEYSATFVSLAQSMQYLSTIIAPMLGTYLADYIGLGGALWLSAGLRLIGFLLFLKPDKHK